MIVVDRRSSYLDYMVQEAVRLTGCENDGQITSVETLSSRMSEDIIAAAHFKFSAVQTMNC